MKANCFLSLIIPCYNEEKTLTQCVEQCLKLTQHNVQLELVIVDDCSTDNSYAIAQKLTEKYSQITLLKHEVNKGKGAALRTGFLYAKGDYIGVQDADSEYNPMNYLTLLQPLIHNKADVVYGSRYLRPDTRRVLYFWHTWMNKTLTTISNMFTNLDITDMETCYKLFKKELIQNIAPQLQEDRFGFEPEITAYVAQANCRVYECAIHYNPRSYEEGKKIGWKDGVRALYCIMHYSAHTAPLPMQIILYFFIGLVCALANIIIFYLLSNKTLWLATSVAFFLSALLNYILCILILFKHKARWTAPKEILMYAGVVVFMWLLDYSLTASFAFMGCSLMFSKILAILIAFIGNFVLRKYLVF